MRLSNRKRVKNAMSATEEPLVKLDGAGVRRDGRWIVHNIDLKVSAGEIVTMIGPNGSGKSTTVELAIGLIAADEGSVRRAEGLSIGYVPQRLSIDRTLPLTVARLMTLAAPHSTADVSDALRAVGIPHLASAQVQHLSGGEFQRALLARALIGKPKLMVLDEPVQGVDFSGELALYELIRRIRDETGCGILLISHDLHMVMADTDTVVCLNGHVCCTGTPGSVASSPEYAELFGPRAAEVLAVYRHHHDHVHLPDGRVRHADGSVSDDCHAANGSEAEAGAGKKGGDRGEERSRDAR